MIQNNKISTSFFRTRQISKYDFLNPEKATVKKMFWVKVAKYEIIFCHINKVLKYQRKIISNKSLYIKNVTTFFLFYDLPHVINHHKFCNVTISQFLSRHKTPFGSDQHKDYIASQKGRLSIFTVLYSITFCRQQGSNIDVNTAIIQEIYSFPKWIIYVWVQCARRLASENLC